MINMLTDGWVVSSESEHFASFSELSSAEKRIQHLIDDIHLPYRQMYRIYQKDKNIVVAIKTLQWKFARNRFFIKTTFDTLATITPTRVYSTKVDSAAQFVCKHLGFEPHIHINKILFRQIIKKGKSAYDDYLIKHEEEIYCHRYGCSWDDIVTYSDDPKLFLEKAKMPENDELRDLLYQAKKLNRIVKTSWSSRRIHDEHMKWTEEIHQLKTRNCSTEPIWEKSVKLPEGVTLLNSEKEIANEGSSMHHCIYTNYCNALKNKRMIAFHVVNKDGDFTCSFRIKDNQIEFDQAYKAWNKRLTDDEMTFARFLKHCVIALLALNPIEQKKQTESQLFHLDDLGDLELF
jgi:hypothetical protein